MGKITPAMKKAANLFLSCGKRHTGSHDAAKTATAVEALLRNPESKEVKAIVDSVCARNCAVHGFGQGCKHGWCRKRQRYLLRLMMSSHPAAKNRLKTFRRVNNAVFITQRLLE